MKTSEAGLSNQMAGKPGTQLRLKINWSWCHWHPETRLSVSASLLTYYTAFWFLPHTGEHRYWLFKSFASHNVSYWQGTEIPQLEMKDSWRSIWDCVVDCGIGPNSSHLPESLSFVFDWRFSSQKTNYTSHDLTMSERGEDSSVLILSPGLRRPLSFPSVLLRFGYSVRTRLQTVERTPGYQKE